MAVQTAATPPPAMPLWLRIVVTCARTPRPVMMLAVLAVIAFLYAGSTAATSTSSPTPTPKSTLRSKSPTMDNNGEENALRRGPEPTLRPTAGDKSTPRPTKRPTSATTKKPSSAATTTPKPTTTTTAAPTAQPAVEPKVEPKVTPDAGTESGDDDDDDDDDEDFSEEFGAVTQTAQPTSTASPTTPVPTTPVPAQPKANRTKRIRTHAPASLPTTMAPTLPEQTANKTSDGDKAHPSAGAESRAPTPTRPRGPVPDKPVKFPDDKPVHLSDRIALTRAQWATLRGKLQCWTGDEGTWVDEYPTPSVPLRFTTYNPLSLGCVSPEHRNNYTSNPGMFYVWRTPQRCPLKVFSAADVCKLLAGRNLWVLGDSTQYTAFHSVFDLMSPHNDSANPVAVHEQYALCPGHEYCGADSRFRFHFRRADFLDPSPELGDPEGVFHQTANFRWIQFINNQSVLFVNRGLHWVDTPDVLAELSATIAAVRARAPGALIVFRPSPEGHGSDKRPTKPLTLAEYTKFTGYKPSYHWGDLPKQGVAIHQMLHDLDAGVIFLDIDLLTKLRHDQHLWWVFDGEEHRDGVHYCQPGPTDTWIQLLMNALDAVREMVGDAVWFGSAPLAKAGRTGESPDAPTPSPSVPPA